MIETRKRKMTKERLEDELSYACTEVQTLLMQRFRKYCVTNHLNNLYDKVLDALDVLCNDIVEEFVENGDF